MHRTIATAQAARRCLAQTRKKTPCQCPAIRRKRRCRMHGGHLTGGPRGNQYAVKHGRYTARMVALKRQARQEQRRLQGLALLARYGFSSFDEVLAALQARGNARHEG
jgi:hypothetical protein